MAVMARESWTDERIDHLAGRIDERFDQVDAEMKLRFNLVDERFKLVDERFEQMDQRFAQVDKRFEQVDKRMAEMNHRFDRIEGSIKDLHADNKALQNTVTHAIVAICATMIGGFAAIVAALIGAAAF